MHKGLMLSSKTFLEKLNNMYQLFSLAASSNPIWIKRKQKRQKPYKIGLNFKKGHNSGKKGQNLKIKTLMHIFIPISVHIFNFKQILQTI